MLGFYNYTVVLTYIGMLFSFVGLNYIWNGDIKTAVLCLMISGFCDMFDGKVASTKKDRTINEKRFGIQIDSLSDLICFGVLPAILLSTVPEKAPLHINLIVAGFYLLCALVRLAYFNVDEEERQSKTKESRTVYLGLPVTTIALVLPLLFFISSHFQMSLAVMGSVALFVVGVGFLTPFQLKKPGTAGKLLMVVAGIAEFILVIME